MRVTLGAQRTPRILIFRMATIIPTVRLRYRRILPLFRREDRIRLHEQLKDLNRARLLPISGRANVTTSKTGIRRRLAFIPSHERYRPYTMNARQVLRVGGEEVQ